MRKVKPRFEQVPLAVVKKMIAERSRKKNGTGNDASLLKTPNKATVLEAQRLTGRRHAPADYRK